MTAVTIISPALACVTSSVISETPSQIATTASCRPLRRTMAFCLSLATAVTCSPTPGRRRSRSASERQGVKVAAVSTVDARHMRVGRRCLPGGEGRPPSWRKAAIYQPVGEAGAVRCERVRSRWRHCWRAPCRSTGRSSRPSKPVDRARRRARRSRLERRASLSPASRALSSRAEEQARLNPRRAQDGGGKGRRAVGLLRALGGSAGGGGRGQRTVYTLSPTGTLGCGIPKERDRALRENGGDDLALRRADAARRRYWRYARGAMLDTFAVVMPPKERQRDGVAVELQFLLKLGLGPGGDFAASWRRRKCRRFRPARQAPAFPGLRRCRPCASRPARRPR